METMDQTVSRAMSGLTTTSPRSSPRSLNSSDESKRRALSQFRDAVEFKTCDDPGLEKLLLECSKFWGAVRRQERPRWLVLIGDTGTGKTHMAKKLVRLAQKLTRLHGQGDVTLGPRSDGRSYRGAFYSWPKVVGGFFRGDYEQVQDIRDEWFVAIDDIGSTRAKKDELVIDQLFQILDGRHDKWTVITSNKSLQDLAAIELRIQDRLMRRGSQVVITETISYSMR